MLRLQFEGTPPKVLNTHQVAAILGCSRHNINHLIKNGAIQATRIHARGRWYITPEETTRYLNYGPRN